MSARMIPATELPDLPHHRFFSEGVPTSIEIPDVSLYTLFEEAAKVDPDRIAFSFLTAKISWRDTLAECEALARGLEEMGVERGDRVILDLQNSPQFVLAYFAILRIDAVVVPVNPMYRQDELAHLISDSGAKVVIAAAEQAGWAATASAQLEPEQRLRHIIAVDLADAAGGRDAVPGLDIPEDWKTWLTAPVETPVLEGGEVHAWTDIVARGGAPSRSVEATGDDLQSITYTSGTSGAPKGVMTRHSAIVHQMLTGALWFAIKPGDASLVVIPMFHVTGLVMGLFSAIRGGATAVILPRWDRAYALRQIIDENVTHWINVPTMVIDLLAGPAADDAMKKLRVIGGGGAAMPQVIEDKLRDQYGLDYLTGYGLTESVAAATTIPRGGARSGTIGIPFVSTEMRVIESVPGVVAEPKELPVGEAGEMVIRGPQVTTGYWNLPEATKQSFVTLDGHRYFRTGDIGSVDEDGYFTITDRLKRLINASGFKVSPAEVEEVLITHEAVLEPCVIRDTDPRRGESVRAVIVLKPDYRGKVTEQEIIDFCKDHLAAYKYPRAVEFVESLPHTTTGKLLWREVQEDHDRRAAEARGEG